MKIVTSKLLFLKVTILMNIVHLDRDLFFWSLISYVLQPIAIASPLKKRKEWNVLIHPHTYHIRPYQPARLNYGILRLPTHWAELLGKAKISNLFLPYTPPGSFFILVMMSCSWMLLCSITRVVLQCWVLNTVSTTSQLTAQV